MKRVVLIALGLTAAAALAGMAYVRTAPIVPGDWHADPARAERTGAPNDFLVAEGGDRPPVAFDADPITVLAAFDAVAMAQPGVDLIAGDPAEGHATYLQRSDLVGFPDFISVRAVAEGEGTLLTIWSRSRFGYSDMGVNAARVEDWLAQLAARL